MSKIKNFKDYMSWQITLSDYLVKYYNYPDGIHKDFTHDDIEKHLPFIKITDCSLITREQICTGEVVLVKDSKGIVFAYQNPFTYESYDDFMEQISDNDNLSIYFDCEDVDIFHGKSIKSMNCYELKLGMEKAKKMNNYFLYKLFKRELCSRKSNNVRKNKILNKIRVKEERMMLDD